MYTLTEHLTFAQAGLLTEAATDDSGKKNWYLKGVCMQGDVRNRNNRIYPADEIKSAVATINSRIKEKETVYGELDHPAELTVNLQNCSHFIQEMWMEGANGHGKMKIMNTTMGNIAQAMLDAGGTIGVSTRGSGDVDSLGVVHDFEIITVDLVCTNSAPAARPVAVFESLNGGYRSGIREDLARAVMHDPKAQKYLVREMIDWIDKLK